MRQPEGRINDCTFDCMYLALPYAITLGEFHFAPAALYKVLRGKGNSFPGHPGSRRYRLAFVGNSGACLPCDPASGGRNDVCWLRLGRGRNGGCDWSLWKGELRSCVLSPYLRALSFTLEDCSITARHTVKL